MNLREKCRKYRMVFLCRYNIKKAVEIVWNGNYPEPIHWEKPETINEKLQILKVGEYYNNPEITRACDKVTVKAYIAEKNINCLCANIYAVYAHAKDIDWDSLPRQFVIKCNHGCGYNIICENKDMLDKEEVRKELEQWMKEDYWTKFAEPQYKYIKKRILIEEYLGDSIHTYKFYSFHGEPKVMYISSNGENGEYDKYYDYYDMDFHWLDVTLRGHEHKPDANMKPDNWEELKDVAKKLSKDFKFVRVDLYSVNHIIYLSELTFVPTGGYMHLLPVETEKEWGEWLTLS